MKISFTSRYKTPFTMIKNSSAKVRTNFPFRLEIKRKSETYLNRKPKLNYKRHRIINPITTSIVYKKSVKDVKSLKIDHLLNSINNSKTLLGSTRKDGLSNLSSLSNSSNLIISKENIYIKKSEFIKSPIKNNSFKNILKFKNISFLVSRSKSKYFSKPGLYHDMKINRKNNSNLIETSRKPQTLIQNEMNGKLFPCAII